MLSAKTNALRSTSRALLSRLRPLPILVPETTRISPVLSRWQRKESVRNFSASSLIRSQKILGVAAALKAKEDSEYVVKPEIFDEFNLKDRVGIVSWLLVWAYESSEPT
jgi:hypothetical protein